MNKKSDELSRGLDNDGGVQDRVEKTEGASATAARYRHDHRAQHCSC